MRPGRAVVVGSGLGGLTAALALRRVGWEVRVLERDRAVPEVGAGITLFPNAMRALRAVGVDGPVREVGAPPSAGVGGLRRPDGRWVARVASAAVSDMVVLLRTDLHRVLREQLPAATVRNGVEVTRVRNDGARSRVVHRSEAGRDDVHARDVLAGDINGDDPDAGHFDDFDADLVVAADGLRSVLREQVVPGHPGPAYAGYTSWRGVTSVPVDVSSGVGETWGRGERFGIVPLKDGRVYWFATATLAMGTHFLDEHAEVTRRFDRWHDPIPRIIEVTEPGAVLHHDTFFLEKPLPTFVGPRIALLGDAAHAMTPDLGQGACQAMEDAAVLAAALADSSDVHSSDVDTALRAYDDARRQRTQQLVRAARRMSRFAQVDGALSARIREMTIRATPSRLTLRLLDAVTAWEPPALPPVTAA